jgi:hypothetical protein
MTILGIDPGKSGAVAVLDEGGDLLKVLDMPSTPEANGSRQLIDGESKGKNHWKACASAKWWSNANQRLTEQAIE